MVAIRKRFPLTALLGLAALTPAGVWAQDPTFQVPHSRYVSQPAPTTWGNAGSCVPSAGYYNPYVAYGATGAALSGWADQITSQGEYLNQYQQSKILKEQAEQAKIDTQRKAFDEWLYERDRRPTLEDDRERQRIESMRRARGDPPVNEIWSGQALNVLLTNLQRAPSQGTMGPSVPLGEDVLRHINVTAGGAGSGSLGVLSDPGPLKWPLTLKGSAYKAEREKFDKLAALALQQAPSGGVDGDTITGLQESLDQLQRALKKSVSRVSANDYIRAKRYLNDLEASLTALQDPNVGKMVNRRWVGNARTVDQLVSQMSRQGLSFAPVTQGDQPAYLSLHTAMVAYSNSLDRMMGVPPPPPPK